MSCPFCHCTNSTVVYDTMHYYMRCDGCGARGPLALWRKKAEDYWEGKDEPMRIFQPKQYIP